MDNQTESIPEGIINLSEFRRLLHQISKELSVSDLDEMKFLIKDRPDTPGRAELEKAKSYVNLFDLLLKYGNISESDDELLIYLLNEIGHNALIKRYKDWKKDTARHSASGNSTIKTSSETQTTVTDFSITTSWGTQTTSSCTVSISTQTAYDALTVTDSITFYALFACFWSFQDAIFKYLKAKDAAENIRAAARNVRAELLGPELVQLLCKECNAYITSGNFLHKNGCHYTCTDPDIGRRVQVVEYGRPQVFRDTMNKGLLKCANPTCGQRLGIAVNFLDDENGYLEGYGFGVKSFHFKFANDETRRYKQWQKVPVKF